MLVSRFQVETFHEFIMAKHTNKATRQLSQWKGQLISWFVQAMSSEKVGASREQNTQRYQQKQHSSPWG